MGYYLIIIFFILLLSIKKYLNWNIDLGTGNILKRIHYITMGLLFITWIIYSTLNMQFRGFWTTRIFIYTFLITGTVLSLVSNKDILNEVEAFYFRMLRYLQILFWIFTFVPYLGWSLLFMAFDTLMPRYSIVYNDSRIRIQNTANTSLGQPQLEIIRYRGGFFEQLFYADEDGYKAYRPTNRARVVYYSDSTHIFVWSDYKDYKSDYSHKYLLKNIDADIDVKDKYSAIDVYDYWRD